MTPTSPPRSGLLRVLLSVSALALLGVALPSGAVKPERFVHTTEADFEPGTFEGTAVTNLGDLELAATTALLAELPPQYTVVYDVVEVDGETYVAVGPEGAVFRLTDAPPVDAESDEADAGDAEEISEDDAEPQADAEAEAADDEEAEEPETPMRGVELVAEYPGEQVFTLHVIGQEIAAGVSGAASRIVVLETGDDAGTIEQEAALPEGVRYVWDIAEVGPEFLVATGPEGIVYRMDDDEDGNPAAETLINTAQANVLKLAATPDADGNPGFPVYAGTDTDGIVYRLDEDGTTTAVYDTAEPEVAALVVAADGTLYIGTADADQARPGRMDGAADADTGRPDSDIVDGEPDEAPGPDDPEDPPLEPEPSPMAEDAEAADAESDADNDVAAEEAALDEDAAVEEADTDDAEAEIADAMDDADAPADDDGLAEVSPTPEQYDALRDEVRRRLEAARKSGKLSAGGKKSAAAPKPSRARAAGSPEASAKEGNAVYRLDPDGVVTEVFRESAMVLALHLDKDAGRLLVATGSEGQLYEVKLRPRETAVLQDLDTEQVTALHASDGDNGAGLILGTANPATLRTVADDDQKTGTYTSAPLDAEQISLWGKLLVALDQPDTHGDAVKLETRTGAVADPDAAAWSEWADATLADRSDTTGLLSFEVQSPPARFVQYRLTLTPGDQPVAVDRVELAYVTPNLAPRITSFTAAYGDTPEDPDEPTPTVVNLEWEAEDANEDRLQYTVHARPAGEDAWLTVVEDLTDTSHEWETKALPDGRYTLRVVAHDRLDNPRGSAKAASRRSEPLVVDNTPPTFVLDPDQDADAPAGRMIGRATDALSPIAAVEYRVADDEPWRPALPDDLIYDSTTEAFSFTIPRLVKGAHVLTVRARDSRGNSHTVARYLAVPAD